MTKNKRAWRPWIDDVKVLFGAGVIGVVGCGVLVACGPVEGESEETETGEITNQVRLNDFDGVGQFTMTLEDGRDVTCILFKGNSKGGLSCDWEGATSGE